MPFKVPAKTRQRKGPSDVVGVDFGSTSVKAIRMRKGKDGISVVGAAILSPDEVVVDSKLNLPRNLTANYAALTITGENAIVRILGLPGHTEEVLTEPQIREHVGLGPEYRIAYTVAVPPRGKTELKILVVAIPEEDARKVLQLVEIGAPAPCSLEVSGLAALSAFLSGYGDSHAHDAVGVIESGSRATFMALMYKNHLSLLRKFDFGADSLVAKVQQQLGVDMETARGIISDGSFDISQPVHEVMDPFLRQLSISKDFVERREDCRIAKLYVSGGTSLSRYWTEEIRNASGVEVERWNPFAGLSLSADAIPESLQGQESRFVAAAGACLGVFEES